MSGEISVLLRRQEPSSPDSVPEPWVPACAGTQGIASGVRFAGYAALFDREDRGGDIIRKGAFARAIRAWRGRRVPLLWQHRPDAPIGFVEAMAEDARGLRVIGRVRGDVEGEAAAMLKGGKVNGLSFGYRVTRSDGRAPRVLKDLELVEVSLVRFPMQPGARVHMVEG
tara:strand:- start:3962 stop:4468 length:507 start_codon:yes stop_codon:yes gene_type:complete